MLRRIRDLEGWTIVGADGSDVGSVDDFYMDQERWTVRYLVADTGGWLVGRRVLVSPFAIVSVEWDKTRVRVDLTRDQVRDAPSAETEVPISQAYESTYSAYYGYPPYWVGPGVWGMAPTPVAARQVPSEPRPDLDERQEELSRLQSLREVSGYHIKALDGEIGHVDDFLVDEESWTVRYLLIDTSNWIGGRTVLVSPEWARHVDWAGRQVHLDVTRQQVKESPEYDPGLDIDGVYQERLSRHYRREPPPNGRRP